MKKRFLFSIVVSLSMNFSITDVLAEVQQEPYSLGFSQTALSEKDTKVLEALQKAYPQNRIRFARETAVAGFYEVILGDGVSYVFINSETLTQLENVNTQNRDRYFRHWLFGGVFYDMQKQVDLTAPLKTLAQMIDVTKLPLQNAITREKGTPQHTLYVFTDPRCPFCKKLEETLAGLGNIRIHTFLTPLTSLHPDAKEVSARIWCAKDKIKAFEKVMIDAIELTTPAQCTTAIEENEKLMRKLGIKGTPTIFFENGERVTGAINAQTIKEKLEAIAKIKNAVNDSAKENR